ncbi:hypothetical protein BLNAU_4913 [Blattamonas nauphoetae]|uniref:Uncharacterized protein n=1 Tax=Blattamonas nauphoetae TaxID=2049346 RepID=A0ABQ9Y8G9_9EUKA|nr:hypothetical protein BLNAU_4913 [Blattamonas nauphoetae]
MTEEAKRLWVVFDVRVEDDADTGCTVVQSKHEVSGGVLPLQTSASPKLDALQRHQQQRRRQRVSTELC